MKKNKLFTLLLCTTLTTSGVLAACGTPATLQNQSSSAEETSGTDADYRNQTISGTVSKIENSTITLSVGGGAPNGNELPVKPGENGDSSNTPPEKPDGEMNSGEKTEVTIMVTDNIALTNEEGEAIALSDIEVGKMLNVTYDAEGNVTAIQISKAMMPEPGNGGSEAPTEYTAVKEYKEDTTEDGQTYTSSGTDENAIHVLNNASVKLTNANVERTSDNSSGGDAASFYGVGAGILNTAGTTIIKDSNIHTSADGGAGVFSYGDGVTYVSDTSIKTENDTSGGIHAAGGGTLYAWNLNVETEGTSSAAIRSDRGGGTMVVDGGTYTSNGSDSPAVYVTADIAIQDASLVSKAAEGVCIEGLNTLNLYNTDITSNMTTDSRNDVLWNIIVYQSMSGDSEEGNGTFSMTGGSITANEGGIFYTTNTESTFYLKDVAITYPEDNQFFLRATGNSNQRGWGSTGSNGANTNFTADQQAMTGDIITDSISQLNFYMQNGSTLTGTFVRDESSAGAGGNGKTNVYISSDSVWTVTGDSTVDHLYNEGTIQDEDGRTVTIADQNGNVLVQGDSTYTITVESYELTADFSGAAVGDSFSDHAVEQPE